MRCLVLGGGGFIGLNLCEALLAAGHGVRVFERPRLTLDGGGTPSAVSALPGAEWVEGDFANVADVRPALDGIEVVYHLICTTLPRPSNENPVYDIETNLVSTVGMLEAARTCGVRKIVFVSSGGTIYGIPHTLPIPEDHPTAPICSYGITKLAVERYLHLYHHLHGLDYCVLRAANPYGEHQRPTAPQGVISVFLHRALHDEPIEIWGDGRVVRDYVYIGDMVRALLQAMHPTGDARTFNIGSGHGLTLHEVVEAIEAVVGHQVPRTMKPARPVDVPANILDISRARAVLGWEPHVALADGIARTMRWLVAAESSAPAR